MHGHTSPKIKENVVSILYYTLREYCNVKILPLMCNEGWLSTQTTF